jgi:16S rRNA (adenine1518-N6/adenine1519-N6)-dimethyltransferase
LCVDERIRDVVEVGPGTGVLTAALLEAGARVRAIEIDPRMIQILAEQPDLAGAQVVIGDALTYDYDDASRGPWCAAGNLPYNIGTQLLLRWIGRSEPERIVAMVQRDVADRLSARAGGEGYGSLTLAVQYAMQVRRAFVLGPQAFYPRPKVDSAVVVLERRAEPAVAARDPAFLLQVVRAGFAYRRKTLSNSLALALGIDRERTQAVLATIGLDTEIRAEQLDLDGFAALADRLAP